MTAQLAAALKRSIFPALLAALAAAGASVAQVQIGADPTQVWITVGLGAFSAAAIVVIRGVGEGLNDGQRAAIGKVLASDVLPTAESDVNALLAPVAAKTLTQSGLKATTDQVQSLLSSAENGIQSALTQAIAETHAATAQAPAKAAPAPADQPATTPATDTTNQAPGMPATVAQQYPTASSEPPGTAN